MWKGNLLDRLSLEYDDFSKGQKKIADYIMRQYDKAAFMTAGAMSEKVGVSESTIVRFAYTMGYDGYPKMQKDLQEVIQNKLTTIQRLNLMEGLSMEEIITASFKTDIGNLRVTREKNAPQTLARVVDILMEARRVYILGARSSGPLAEFLAYYMGYMMDNVHLIRFSSDVFSQIVHADERDAVIAISFPRYSMRTAEVMSALKMKKCNIIAITDREHAPPAELASHVLLAKSYMNSFVDSFVAPLSIINVLIVLLGLRKKDVLTENFNTLEEFWKQNEVYARNNKAGAKEADEE
ncbi:MAG TPA: N-acetylmannosamine kinase [Clostridiales bacterium]|nr:N-acetylmannosamine kinase [Clostridiales bacterium]